ncbi:MAG: hypothetical protein ABIQ11_04510 [Saprospiraceae bacterium]
MKQFTPKAFFKLLLKGMPVLPGLCVVALVISSISGISAQDMDVVNAIRELKDGYLIVRMPSSRAKIDTLTQMVNRSKDPGDKVKLQKMLKEASEERDSLIADYTLAFKNRYNFSKVAYFMDYEVRDLPSAHFYTPDGSAVRWDDILKKPYYFLYFGRTDASKIDALIIHDSSGEIVPRPFPNNFSTGGFNVLVVKILEKSFADWRIGKINRKLHRFWDTVN